MINGRMVNPLVIIDEVDKADPARSTSGASASFTPALLGLLEPESARAWDCPYHRLKFDTSHISWVLTSNHLRWIPKPGPDAAPSASDGGAAAGLRNAPDGRTWPLGAGGGGSGRGRGEGRGALAAEPARRQPHAGPGGGDGQPADGALTERRPRPGRGRRFPWQIPSS